MVGIRKGMGGANFSKEKKKLFVNRNVNGWNSKEGGWG